jgi:CMP-N-acetylneuraminic acid synthetase
VFEQSYDNIEVIIVDNNSTDGTLEKVKRFPISKIVNIDEYLPGDSLNKGIECASGDYIVCLSGHCIPVNNTWLENLVKSIGESNDYAAVYGRQEPMSFSTPSDKRDLLLVFGLDKRVQSKDSFFHNANSIIRKELWDKVKFDPNVTNIEDRIWAQEMLNMGLKIVYEPSASVYHYHGIHHNGNQDRCNNIVRIIEGMSGSNSNNAKLDPKKLNIVAIIPIKDKDCMIGDMHQMEFTINSAKKSKYINNVIVTTGDVGTATKAQMLGAECPFIRREALTKEYVPLEPVLMDVVENLEADGIIVDLVVSLEETFPFRDDNLIDEMIEHLLSEGFDTVIAAKDENGSLWKQDRNKGYIRLDSGDIPREYKENTYVGLKGLCCVTHPEFIRQDRLMGNNVGLFNVKSPLSSIEIRSNLDREIAKNLLIEYKLLQSK